MTAAPVAGPGSPRPQSGASPAAFGSQMRIGERAMLATLRHALRLTPELRAGLPLTLLLALLTTVGRVVVPVAVQQTIDRGLGGSGGGVDLAHVRTICLLAAGTLALCGVANYWMDVRLYRTTETGLAALRLRAFRRVHELSVLHQSSERRGSLVSRVTGDVDLVSGFLQFGGLLVLVATLQLVLATGLMVTWSWQLTLVVYGCFLPLAVAVPIFQRRLRRAYLEVRARVGEMLGAVGEAVVGAPVVRSYGIQDRTAARIDGAIERTRQAQTRAQRLAASVFVSGELTAAVATAAVVVVGVLLGIDGSLTAGRVVGFLFLVALFVQPVQVATEVLNEAQNAVAGLSRVLGILDTPCDVPDPGPDGRALPPGPLDVRLRQVGFAYPEGPDVLHDVDVHLPARTRVAVVGETGSGKTTFAKLLTRLMDPTRGSVEIGGVPLPEVRAASLRSRVVMVPQDGFLFEGTVADNVRYGRAAASDADVAAALTELGLAGWLASLPHGVATPVGQRGEALSVGERQLVAIARAYVADPDVLVLDEATSAVDPATEVRVAAALDRLTRGRTTVTIAHRLSTAEVADEVLVFDRGRLLERGEHGDLAARGGVYARLHASWIAQTR